MIYSAAGVMWILARERSFFWMSHEKKICCKGWYQDRYIISVIHNFDWANPVQQYETTETNQLPALLMEAVYLVEKESRSAVVN